MKSHKYFQDIYESAIRMRFYRAYSHLYDIMYENVIGFWSIMGFGPASFKVQYLFHIKSHKYFQDIHGSGIRMRLQWAYSHIQLIMYENMIGLLKHSGPHKCSHTILAIINCYIFWKKLYLHYLFIFWNLYFLIYIHKKKHTLLNDIVVCNVQIQWLDFNHITHIYSIIFYNNILIYIKIYYKPSLLNMTQINTIL